MNLDYKSAVEWLFEQFPAFQKKGAMAYHPTLDNVLELIQRFDVNLSQFKFIHVAGTNGKGSTCAYIATALTASDFKVGLFTSPHIHDFRERIRINGKEISKNDVVEFVNAIQSKDLGCKPSFFELSWVLSLLHFQRKNCDFVVVETGLGGRLDATNVITPLISVITNVGLDHQNILGETKAEIAKEKAGIIKNGIPVVIGESDDEIISIFKSIAEEKKCDFYLENKTSNSFIIKNQQLAKKSIEILKNHYKIKVSPRAFNKGIENLYQFTGLKGRFQEISKNPKVIIDAAHNKEGVLALFQHINSHLEFNRLHLIYGASNDKNVSNIITLFPENAICYFTTFSNKRSCSFKELKTKTALLTQEKEYYNDVNEAINRAKENAEKEDLVLVFGSFFLLEGVRSDKVES